MCVCVCVCVCDSTHKNVLSTTHMKAAGETLRSLRDHSDSDVHARALTPLYQCLFSFETYHNCLAWRALRLLVPGGSRSSRGVRRVH